MEMLIRKIERINMTLSGTEKQIQNVFEFKNKFRWNILPASSGICSKCVLVLIVLHPSSSDFIEPGALFYGASESNRFIIWYTK